MLSGLAPLRSAVCRASGALTAAARGMAVTAQQLEDRLKEHLQATHVAVTDTSGGCGASFALEVVSPSFEGLKLIQRHRKINEVLKDEIAQIHALQIVKCHTPEQHQQ